MQKIYEHFTVKKEAKMNLSKSFLRIQFLTVEQKAKKELALSQLSKKYDEEEDCIVPYIDSFNVSFRCIFNSHDKDLSITNSIPLETLHCYITTPFSPELDEFIKAYVKNINAFYFSFNLVNISTLIPLYTEREISVYTPSEVLEIIYQQQTLFNRILVRCKNFVKSIPGKIKDLFIMLLKNIFSLVGLGSLQNIIFKIMPSKFFFDWLLTAATMFFPFLLPFVKVAQLFK